MISVSEFEEQVVKKGSRGLPGITSRWSGSRLSQSDSLLVCRLNVSGELSATGAKIARR